MSNSFPTSRLCRVCTEPESLCRCEETPALKLACKLVSEADGTYSQTVTIKHGDFLTLCERAYEWAQDASKAALSETVPSTAIRSIKPIVIGGFVIEYGDGNKAEFRDFKDLAKFIAERDQTMLSIVANQGAE